MNKKVFLKRMSRLMFWKYRRSEIKDILDDFSEYIDIAVSNGENEADAVKRLGSPKSILNEPDIQLNHNLGIIRKISAIVLLIYFFICLMLGNNNPYFLTSITFCIVFPLLLLFVLGGEISKFSTFRLSKGYGFIFWLFPLFMSCCWLTAYLLIHYAVQPGITHFKEFTVQNFGVIFSFLINFQLIVGIAFLLILIRLYLKYQYNIYNALTVWSGVISSILLMKHFFRDLSDPRTLLYDMFKCITPLLLSLITVLAIKTLFYLKEGKRIWMLK